MTAHKQLRVESHVQSNRTAQCRVLQKTNWFAVKCTKLGDVVVLVATDEDRLLVVGRNQHLWSSQVNVALCQHTQEVSTCVKLDDFVVMEGCNEKPSSSPLPNKKKTFWAVKLWVAEKNAKVFSALDTEFEDLVRPER
eukprot:CAMPEP_0114568666 /NCGR_PEP_ID=MMETSP0114-20121206/16185_1 /TAXON_ID=31324 /ORGANISM="Goniomonas sp, Strain m" /LENGTH=137 /DNA_ID=CAMNT_0001755435 /DNA_START=130 /DNA_END=543 /DNA_ORIENTATION=+